MDNDFLCRIRKITGNRYKTPWGAAIGLTRGTTDRIFKGFVPGPETLCIIQKAENVSLDWLLTGRGRPFLLDEPATDDDGVQLLGKLFAGEPADWRADLLSDGLRLALVLSCTDRYYLDGGKPRDYRHMRLIAGAIGAKTLEFLDACNLDEKRLAEVDASTLSLILEGGAGTFALFGDDDHPGLLAESARVLRLGLAVREQPGACGPALSNDEAVLINKYRAMEGFDKRRLQKIGDAIIESEADNDIESRHA